MKKIFLIISIIIISFNSFSQDEYINKPEGFISTGYAPQWGLGEFENFVSYASYRGFFFEGKKFLTSNIAVGGYLGWSGFHDLKDRGTLDFADVKNIKADGAITGNLDNYYYNFPLMASVSYYIKPEMPIKPFITFNLGTVYQKLESYIGTAGILDETWQFQMAPEAGVFIPFGKDAEFGSHIAVRYNYITYQKFKFNGIQSLQLNIGISWLL